MPADVARLARPLREMPLAELRAHRQELREEEHRISYWRRLVQARLDTSAAGRLSRVPLSPRQIVVALGDGVSRHQRLGLLALEAGQELPELPELSRLWATPLSPDGDPGGAGGAGGAGGSGGDGSDDAALRAEATTIAGLADAEARLSTYRTTVHRLLDAATGELIRRYQDDPSACLDVLPAVLPAKAPARRAAAG
ncbi:MAG: hypothetical protein ACJ74O_01040 [Frankiaceae bacterium]